MFFEKVCLLKFEIKKKRIICLAGKKRNRNHWNNLGEVYLGGRLFSLKGPGGLGAHSLFLFNMGKKKIFFFPTERKGKNWRI